MKKIVPAADEAFARERVDQLRKRRFEQIERELDPAITDPNPQDTFSTMAGMFPTDEPKSVKVVDVKFVYGHDSSTHTLTLEYEFPRAWVLVGISIKTTGGHSTITAFNVTPIADGLENVNRFSLEGKSGLQYLMLLLAVALPLFTFYAFAVCLRTKKQNFKGLWAIFILFGVGRLAVNWTTGELSFTLLAVHIPCASATVVPLYGPWVIAVSLPLGAILFMARRSNGALPRDVPSPAPEQPPPSQPQ